ncbi:MAG TPA: NADH-quinone oxidoreductase subunit N [Blastocatellia bacterium]|nr:NADH-quinone oxidoreductase subunit N [Blastocatellia bacterium]
MQLRLDQLGLDYYSILPETITSVVGVVIMMVDAFSKRGARRANATLALVGLGGALAAIVGLWAEPPGSSFSGMIVTDHLRLFFSGIAVLSAIIAVLVALQFLKDEALPPGEFFSLLMFGTCGMLIMAAAGDLVTIFLGLEISSITSYVMAGYRRTDLRANESSLKYFLLGSFSTAFLLYGMTLIYGATATTNIEHIRQAIATGQMPFPQLLLIGAAMMFIGFAFKIGSAPFHLWTPDVYEGAPTLVTAFMATGPKAAVFAAFLRVFTSGFNAPASAAGLGLQSRWVAALAIIAVITMTVGNVIALNQRNIKRMLAYSSIAHAGYALVGFVTGDWGPVAFYMLTYTVMNLGAFTVIQMLARAGDEKTMIADYAGIGFEAPGLSFLLAVFLLSLAGIPPTAGFMGKFFVFKEAWNNAPNLHWLVVAAIINSIISIYYYLYPLVVMFFRPAPERFVKPRVSVPVAVALAITLIATFYLGILPNGVFGLLDSGQPRAAQVFSVK